MPRRSSGSLREVFGKGNDFAKKITYRTDGADPESLIRAFRNDYNPRIAVTVDMIATGTDVKPLEVLIFLRDVKSELYFEQMKGRGARTISPEKLREVTPDAEAKTRFVLIDAVGVSESLKSVSQPLERDRVISFEKLIDGIASGRRDDDAFATLAARLAALDRRIGEKDRAAIVKATGGVDLSGLAARLLDAIDPDALAKRVPREAPEPEQKKARDAAKEEAATLFDDPALRRLLKDVKAAADIRIDTVSIDAVVSSGWDERKATDAVDKFRRFLEERRDELVALQILYALPYARRRLTYAAVDELRDALKRPPWLLEPIDLWRAYKRLSADKVRGNPTGMLADIVMLVRFALGQTETLGAFVVAHRRALQSLARTRGESRARLHRRTKDLARRRSATISGTMSRSKWKISWTRRPWRNAAGYCARGRCSGRGCRRCWRN